MVGVERRHVLLYVAFAGALRQIGVCERLPESPGWSLVSTTAYLLFNHVHAFAMVEWHQEIRVLGS